MSVQMSPVRKIERAFSPGLSFLETDDFLLNNQDIFAFSLPSDFMKNFVNKVRLLAESPLSLPPVFRQLIESDHFQN